MRPLQRLAFRVFALLLSLVATLLPKWATAGEPRMIPPGQEQQIREFVDAALAAARDADEFPVAIDGGPSIAIERDRIRVILDARDDNDAEEPLPRPVLFPPNAIADSDELLAPGVVLECGSLALPIACPASTRAAWASVAARLAAARDPFVEQIWRIEESDTRSFEEVDSLPVRSRAAVWLDRVGAVVTMLLALGLLVQLRRPSERPSRVELAVLLGLLLLFVAATLSFTNLVPLHEHNSFVARSDCAIDERCTDEPAGGVWSMTTLHAYGLLLEAIPYRVEALARLSLAISVILLVLIWALTRRLAIELGLRSGASTAGLGAVAVLASNPVFWRLSGAATFWPWTLSWTLGAALVGLNAARACASERRSERLIGAAGWVVAASCLAFAAASNLVCLTLGASLVLAPACWSRADSRASWASALRRAAWIGPPAIATFALLVGSDYVTGFARAFGSHGLDDRTTPSEMLERFNALLLDPRIVTPVWALAVALGVALAWWVRRRDGSRASQASRLLAPIVYAYLVPAAFLGISAGELIGSSYPTGFLNHHWELAFSAIAVGLALAYSTAALERLRPSSGWLRWGWLVPGSLTLAALLLAPLAREGWRMATGEHVVERELLALERSFAALPEHDLLVVAPRVLEPLTDAPTEWDPLEVVFPIGFYEYALRERGLEPGAVVEFDPDRPPQLGDRTLLYVGSGLRSFQPHEIEHRAVPDQLERPILARLRDTWALEPVLEFQLRTEQHAAASQRLGADRVAEIELGFYWMAQRDTRHE
jgi:hypothetical protein